MATRIVSWGDNEHMLSSRHSKTPSVVSFDSIPSDNPEAPGIQGATPGRVAESLAKRMSSQAIGPSEARTSTSTSIYPGADAADRDDPFTRHNKYFFKDGNVTFLVRGIQL